MWKYVLFLLLAILIFACSKHITEPTISDDSINFVYFEGEKFTDPENPGEYTYKQRAKWELLVNGSDISYAYRIETTNEELPQNIQTNQEGWILHDNTIWSNNNEVEFEFNSVDGTLSQIVSKIDVKCIVDGEEYPAVSTEFLDGRIIGTNATSAIGDINGQTTGTGLRFILSEQMTDIFIEGLYADHFMYRLNIISEQDSSIITQGDWFNTINCPDIRKIKLNSQTEPALFPNNTGELTQFEAYIVTRSGFEDIDNPDRINFKVQDGFYPCTLIYNGIVQDGTNNGNNIFLLGEHHFVDYSTIPIPYIVTPDEIHYATPFWINSEGEYACINSDDLELYMHWGWHGEYSMNYPHLEKVGIVYDEQTDANYYAEITHFDIRLDNEPYQCSALPPAQFNFIDDDGTEWLRIPVDHEYSQRLTLTNLDDGYHTFTVRAVDSQLAVDETPSNFDFKLVPFIPAAEKEGVLILDDTDNNPMFAPEDYFDQIYSGDYFLNGYPGTINVLDRNWLRNNVWNSSLHWGMDVFSPTDLQEYKTVLYYADSPSNPGNINFSREYDVLNLYLKGGGNLILSGGANLDFNLQHMLQYTGHYILNEYFGINTDNNNAITSLSDSFIGDDIKRYFIEAINNSGVYDISLLCPSFNNLVNQGLLQGDPLCALAPVSYFPEDLLLDGAEVIYTFGCRPVGDESYEPTQTEFDFYSQQPVAVKFDTGQNKCYLFGFPLGYMEPDDVNSMLLQILSEIER